MRGEERKRKAAALEDAVKMEVGAVVVDPCFKVVALLVMEPHGSAAVDIDLQRKISCI
jgi:hypothetical protein